MTDQEQRAILAICLHAAFADGAKEDRERARIKEIADGLSASGGAHLASLYQDVLLGRLRIEQAAAALTGVPLRQLAYEMAVCVCDADGAQNAAEAAFLAELRTHLAVQPSTARSIEHEAAQIAGARIEAPPPDGASAGSAPVADQPPDSAALDRMILNTSILNGALELLPQSLATMAILPLQMKMVYRVGKAHGYELDRGHLKDLLATLGVGLTSQYVEEIGRKLIGGLLRGVGGSIAGALGRQATGSAMAFATTYALGQVARTYYGGGRTLSMETLRSTFAGLLTKAQSLRATHADAITQRAKTLDPSQLLALVKRN